MNSSYLLLSWFPVSVLTGDRSYIRGFTLIAGCDMGSTMHRKPGSASVDDLAGLAVRRHSMFSGEGLATKSPFTVSPT